MSVPCGAACAAQVLEGYSPQEWICFERALVVRDIFTGGVRTFLSRADAQAFRSRIYAQYGKCLWLVGPRLLIYLMPSKGEIE